MVTVIFEAVVLAIFGYLMANVLTAPGEIFDPAARLIERLTGGMNARGVRFWLWKVTVGCAKCIAGNAALWYGISIHGQYFEAAARVVLAVYLALIIQRYETDKR